MWDHHKARRTVDQGVSPGKAHITSIDALRPAVGSVPRLEFNSFAYTVRRVYPPKQASETSYVPESGSSYPYLHYLLQCPGTLDNYEALTCVHCIYNNLPSGLAFPICRAPLADHSFGLRVCIQSI